MMSQVAIEAKEYGIAQHAFALCHCFTSHLQTHCGNDLWKCHERKEKFAPVRVMTGTSV